MSGFDRYSTATWLAKAGFTHDAATGGVTPAIPLSTTYVRDRGYELPDGRIYVRDDNPLFEHFESILAQLEGAADAAVFSSGLAAMAAVVATLGRGDRVILARQCYYGVRTWLLRESSRVGFELEFFDLNVEDDLARAIAGRSAALVWVESPANPTWEVVDIAATAEAAHDAGARLVVDATVTTPLICRPLEHGADYVMHSATKFLNGHSDVLAGALACARADEHWDRIREVRRNSGAVIGPFEAWLLIRGMRTLQIRLERACANAMAIARHFEHHPSLRKVLYPGLEGSPGHAIARSQWNTDVGFTAMISLCLGGDAASSRRFAASTKIFLPATSLGGVESLIEHRKTVEEGTSEVPEDLVRLSVGIEDPDELIADLEQALAG